MIDSEDSFQKTIYEESGIITDSDDNLCGARSNTKSFSNNSSIEYDPYSCTFGKNKMIDTAQAPWQSNDVSAENCSI